MAKVKQPLFSLDARRKLGDDIVFARRAGSTIVEKHPEPRDARSVGQLSWRHMFLKVVALWHALSAAEKEAWESLARSRHMTGYAWFVSQALRPNPGIYLPLQGGTMSGQIAMGTNSIIGLPHPTGSGHAARKSYVDGRVAADILTHKGDASAHHGRYTDGEALAASIAGGLNKIVWLATSVSLVDLAGQVNDIAWTDVDITAHTSASTKFAILMSQLWVTTGTGGSVAYIGIRKNGDTPAQFVTIGGRCNAAGDDAIWIGNPMMAVDGGQVFEYTLDLVVGMTCRVMIALMGYIE